jgi:hypothetical protein
MSRAPAASSTRPNRDLAVLYVPNRRRPRWRSNAPAETGADAIVVGYPLNGPFARLCPIRDVSNVKGPNIYEDQNRYS